MSKEILEDEFNSVYKKYYSEIYKFCLVKLDFNSSFAEDCCQNTFMTFYNKLKQGVKIENHRAYIYKIASINVLRMYNELSKSANNIELDSVNDIYYETLNEKVEYKLIINQISKLLNEDELQLLYLKFEQGYSNKEIAAILNISETACLKRIYRIKLKIRNEVKL